jgi:hypothetical protein
MKSKMYTAMLVAGIAFASSANAAPASSFADFTNSALFNNAVHTQLIGGTLVTISSNSGALNFSEIAVGNGVEDFCAAQGGLLSCTQDGVGILDDEITGPGVGPSQSLTVTFSRNVAISGLSFLDLFKDPRSNSREHAIVDFGTGANGNYFGAQEYAVGRAGYLSVTGLQGIFTKQITFTAGGSNDGMGNPDYALAGINFNAPVSEVPVPAAAWLFGSGLIGLATLRRRKRIVE